MHRRSMFRLSAVLPLIVMLLSLSFPEIMPAEQSGRRFALVVGNAAYKQGALPNPVHDATDVAEALKKADFKVTLKTDLSLRDFETALRQFGNTLKAGDTVLFFYAGHGVEVDGINYLVPVDNADISQEGDVKYKAFDMARVLDEFAAKGTALNIVILDACRDNPLKSRSQANRGLAVMAAPRGTETVIVYSTAPGSTAADGTGRNSVFTSSFLAELSNPDVSIRELFDKVGTSVKAATGGRQTPWLNTTPLSQPFYFITVSSALTKARAEGDSVRSELALLEEQIRAREAAMRSAKNEKERQALEVEQKRAQALEAAKRLELENNKKETERLAREAERRKNEEAERKQLQEAELRQVAALKEQAEERRKEYERLIRKDDSAEEFFRQIASMEDALAEIGSRYEVVRQAAEAETNGFYKDRLEELKTIQPDPWESDEEFQERITKTRVRIEEEWSTGLEGLKKRFGTEKAANEAPIRMRMDETFSELEKKAYTLSGSSVDLIYGDFDRDKKFWPVTLESLSEELPFRIVLEHSLASAEDLPKAFADTVSALKAEALLGEISYRYQRGGTDDRVIVIVTESRVRDVTNNRVLVSGTSENRLFWFLPSEPEKKYFTGTLRVTSDPEGAKVEADGKRLGKTPCTVELEKGEHDIEVSWPFWKEFTSEAARVTIDIGSEETLSVTAEAKPSFQNSSIFFEFRFASLAEPQPKNFGGYFAYVLNPPKSRLNAEMQFGIFSAEDLDLLVDFGCSFGYTFRPVGNLSFIPYFGFGFFSASQKILSSDYPDSSATGAAWYFLLGMKTRLWVSRTLALNASAAYNLAGKITSWEENDSGTAIASESLAYPSYSVSPLRFDLGVSVFFNTQ